jgi:hypothetical protein
MSMSAPFEPGRRTPGDPPERLRDDVPFRTPDPGDVGRS